MNIDRVTVTELAQARELSRFLARQGDRAVAAMDAVFAGQLTMTDVNDSPELAALYDMAHELGHLAIEVEEFVVRGGPRPDWLREV